ncbi:hypothetical protein [Sphingomonas yabuuchiae]|uniref:Uncharacterized protein n=1 Tax=Sphingomonas yabuuchiae TaxID=172044 RepID=A0AA41DBJ7_9SPHN|nr:hypothetical protein [Sphingomonas yabuuchiae]MBB4609623.1 hypothetical protein [Sphingomonas yabuuchiae]MBN3557936.1 hypothetical protein [Sphingomonas yabuuchiae]
MTSNTQAEKALTEVFHEWVASTVDPEGFPVPHALVRNREGTLTVVALAVPPTEAYAVMLKLWHQGAEEMIFALDRFALPGQGTTLGDLLAGFHFTRHAAPRPFIIEYQHAPRIVRPIDWDNVHWTAGLYGEFNQVLRQRLGIAPEKVQDTVGGRG